MGGGQRDSEPGCQVRDGVVLIGVQGEQGEQIGLMPRPEHRHQRGGITTHKRKIASVYA